MLISGDGGILDLLANIACTTHTDIVYFVCYRLFVYKRLFFNDQERLCL